MAKLVVCIDGTWNAPGAEMDDIATEENEGGSTNVARTWEFLTQKTLDHARPYGSIAPLANGTGEAVYLNGVGSAGTAITRTIAGATGTGTAERIRDAYRFLAERYTPDAEIYGFGFSRGAFAVRSLMGFLDKVGLPHGTSRNLIREDELIDLYSSYRLQAIKNRKHEPVAIKFLGLWDTVGALAFRGILSATDLEYHHTSPGNVQNVAHALALDERRKQFQPDLYRTSTGAQTKVREVWFAGAHSDVGGGYENDTFSHIAFFWVLGNALESGLTMDLASHFAYPREGVSNGQLNDSYDQFFRRIPILGQRITKLKLFQAEREFHPAKHKIHESVLDLMKYKTTYKPHAKKVPSQIPPNLIEPWGFH